MKKKLVETALEAAYQLLSDEIQSVELDELRGEYLAVIYKIEIALNEVTKGE